MNKKILISAILTAAPTAQLTATEIVNVRIEANRPLLEKQNLVFAYPTRILGEDDSYDLRVSLVPANADRFNFWDIAAGLEAETPDLWYELVVQFVSRHDGKVLDENLHYFLRRVGEGKFALHQTNTTTIALNLAETDHAYEVITCNTTQSCGLNSTDRGLVKIEGDELTIVNPSEVFAESFAWSQLEGKVEKTLVFKKIEK